MFINACACTPIRSAILIQIYKAIHEGTHLGDMVEQASETAGFSLVNMQTHSLNKMQNIWGTIHEEFNQSINQSHIYKVQFPL
jgi:hypothetical protein